MTRDHATNQSGLRLPFVDNLRWVTIVLVISMHAADTYSPLGNWYFVDRGPISGATLLTFAAWQMYLQSFFMGLLFFLSGIFVPGSLERKGTRRFLRERLFRLGFPVLFYTFVLGPVTEYFFAHSWNSTERTSFAHEWIKHIRNGQFLQENGPLWFCLALLIFCFVYAGLRSLLSRRARKENNIVPNTKALFLFALVLSASRFTLRSIIPPDTSILNMHIGDFAQYVLLFWAGTRAGTGGWLKRFQFRSGILWLAVVLPAGFAAWLILLHSGGAMTGRWRDFSGGWHWQSAAFSVWESFTCVACCYELLVLFREYFNVQNRVTAFLSTNAFAVYVFHPPVVIFCARLMHSLSVPAVPKALTLTAVAAVLSFAASAAIFRRIPLLRAVL